VEKLVIDGGKPARAKPFPARTPYGKEEIKEVTEAINSQNLFRWGGTKVSGLERKFAAKYGIKHAVASTSGTSAIHIALGAINPNPGDEVITAPITDMGTITGILFQNCIPVFADVDPDSFNMDPADIEKKITKRTKAIIVVHLFGNPADMGAVMRMSKKYGIPVIEDCCQAYMTYYKSRLAGTIGDIGCFSMQQSKHLCAGDGGITITDNKKYADRMLLFADKGWNRTGFGPRAYLFLAPNYRMNELTAAVALAQLKKLDSVVRKRRQLGILLNSLIKKTSGIKTLKIFEGCRPSFSLYGFKVLDAPAEKFASALNAEGVPCGSGYIGKPIFVCSEALHSKTTYGNSHCPFDCPKTDARIEYKEGLCPVTDTEQPKLITIGINENFTKADIRDIAAAVNKVSDVLD